MSEKTVAIAGGSGFIGRAIARRLAAIPEIRVRGMSRSPERARQRLNLPNLEWVRAEVTEPSSLPNALQGATAIVGAVQFEGYPVENPKKGLTFERVDFGGTLALLEAAKKVGVEQFVYTSGAAADENSSHPAFRAKGKAERAIRESGLAYTILRPSLVYGPEDKVVNGFAKLLKFSPVFGVPGTGRQTVQPVLVDDLAACVALAISGKGRNGIYDVGGPELMTFDEMIRILMEVTGRRRPIIHIPESAMRAGASLLEMLPTPLLSRDAVTFVTADNATDIKSLVAEFGIQLTPMRQGLRYLAPSGK
jgi:NADH dehydrogenase